MTLDRIGTLAHTLLYEGYLLYPYRRSSVKNRQRWMLGSLYPRSFADGQGEGDPWWMRTECLVRGTDDTELEVSVRFLQLTEPGAVERQVDGRASTLRRLQEATQRIAFTFATDGGAPVQGTLDVQAERLGDELYKISARVDNVTAFIMPSLESPPVRREAALRCAFASAHAILRVSGGAFVSCIDPPATLRDVAAGCRSVGVWPVLVGDRNAQDTMLAGPIILEDYPRIAPESAGDFFDATEIDEMLTLRVLTLTDEEKAAMHAADARAHAILARTQGMAPAQRRVHGASRMLRPGVRVRLAPRPGGDIFDLALAGRAATIVTLEEDYEGRLFVVVTVDDDPGQDLGVDGRPGHRFFFRPEEVEVLQS